MEAGPPGRDQPKGGGVPVGGAKEPRPPLDPVRHLESQHLLVEVRRLLEVRSGPSGVQKLLHGDAWMCGRDPAFVHAGVELDLHSPGITEAQPSLNAIRCWVATLSEHDARV